MALGLAIGVPAEFELIGCELGEEVWPYLSDLVQPVDLYYDFYGLIGEYFSGGGVNLVMRRVVGLNFKADDMTIALILKF